MPIAPFARPALVRNAVNAGASLIVAGPLPSSQIVFNERPGFLLAMLKSGVLPLAATSAGCSAAASRS